MVQRSETEAATVTRHWAMMPDIERERSTVVWIVAISIHTGAGSERRDH